MASKPQRLAEQLIGAAPDGLSELETINAAFRIACSQLAMAKDKRDELSEADRQQQNVIRHLRAKIARRDKRIADFTAKQGGAS